MHVRNTGLGDAWGSETASGAVGADAGGYYPAAVGSNDVQTMASGADTTPAQLDVMQLALIALVLWAVSKV